MRMLPVGDVELCVDEYGDPDGPPVVLLYGAAGSMDWWDVGFCEAIAAGAMAYIPKSLDRASITDALNRVLAGEIWQPDIEGEPEAPDAPVADRIKALTPQQHNILRLMVAGKPNKIIAYELDIAETTVKAHITVILRKLGVFSRTQAVLVARDFFG